MELLKKFQSCRAQLSSTLQKAEQATSEQASYMGKDNLQRSITKASPQHHTYTASWQKTLRLYFYIMW